MIIFAYLIMFITNALTRDVMPKHVWSDLVNHVFLYFVIFSIIALV